MHTWLVRVVMNAFCITCAQFVEDTPKKEDLSFSKKDTSLIESGAPGNVQSQVMRKIEISDEPSPQLHKIKAMLSQPPMESGTHRDEDLSQIVKKSDILSEEPQPRAPKMIDEFEAMCFQYTKEHGTHDQALSHPPKETSSTLSYSTATEADFDFVNRPAQDFFCPVTFELLLNPQQTQCCGHHISETAAKVLKQENKPCPICKAAEIDTVLDKYHQRRVRQVQVRCPHAASGCEWVGEVGELNNHTNTCFMKALM